MYPMNENIKIYPKTPKRLSYIRGLITLGNYSTYAINAYNWEVAKE
jgi:hypothetical protein